MTGLTGFYMKLCTICEHPIRLHQAMPGAVADWHHEDVRLCRQNIRTDTMEHVRAKEGDWLDRLRDETGEQIATAIEEMADDFGWDEIVRTQGDIAELRGVVTGALHDAAALARGKGLRDDAPRDV